MFSGVGRVLAAGLGAVLMASAVGTSAPATRAAAEDEASDIALVLDFSGSILEDEEVRTAFADALDGIADRVEEVSDRLTAGDATVSIVRFATTAQDVPDCTDLALRENPQAVGELAGCLREVAEAYRTGVDPALLEQIGDDTNYVAAMEQASEHLPADSQRPAVIFFTDGRHEAAGVPVSEVVPARDRLFGERTPFALLPVGMGVDPADRDVLEAGLADLRTLRDFEDCEGGTFEWPNVIFDSAEAAGQAVALALQDVSCTFTVEPTPTPAPTPVPTPTPAPRAPLTGVALRPADSAILVVWTAPADAAEAPVEDYRVRCRPAEGGDWIESAEGPSTETQATVEGLTNGVEYACEVAVVRGGQVEAWAAARETAAPFGRPPAPAKPSVAALDRAARVSVSMPGEAPVEGYRYECSADGGRTWSTVPPIESRQPTVVVSGLANGRDYVCRAFATNAVGASDASPVSNVVRPCGSTFECNPALLMLVGGLASVLALLVAFVLYVMYARRRLWVTAQVDHFASVSLGRGPNVGMRFIRRGPLNRVAGIAPAAGRAADVRIRYRGNDRFEVRSAGRTVTTEFGRQAEIPDAQGEVHRVVLRAWEQAPD